MSCNVCPVCPDGLRSVEACLVNNVVLGARSQSGSGGWRNSEGNLRCSGGIFGCSCTAPHHTKTALLDEGGMAIVSSHITVIHGY